MAGFPYTFPFAFQASTTYRKRIQVEVHDTTGALTRVSLTHLGGDISYKVNCPSQLLFKLSKDDPATTSLLSAGWEVWLRGQDGNILNKYRIRNIRTTNDESGPVVEVEALDYLSVLQDCLVQNYTVTALTISEIVADLLTAQTAATGARIVTLGAVDASISALVRDLAGTTGSTTDTIFSLITSLETTVPFDTAFWVDDELKFYWKPLTALTSNGRLVSVAHNAKSIQRDLDRANLCTRLFIYGATVDGSTVTIESVNGGLAYLDSSDYAGAYATPGFRSLAITNFNISDPTLLLEWGNAKRDLYFSPRLNYSLSLVDFAAMSQSIQTEIVLGEMVRIVDDDFSINASARIMELKKNIDDPGSIEITISTNPRRLEDLFSDVVVGNGDGTGSGTGGDPLNPWRSDDNPGEIDGGKIDPNTLDRIVPCIIRAVAYSGATQLYQVESISLIDKSATGLFLNNVWVLDDSQPALSVADCVSVFIPSKTRRANGEHYYILPGGGSGTGGDTILDLFSGN